jgi:hypothetical protein
MADQTPATGQDPTVEHGGPHDVTVQQPGDEKTVPVPTPPVEPPKEKWEGRVKVAGAAGLGQKKAAAPVAQTQKIARYADASPTAIAPRARPAASPGPQQQSKRQSRRRGRRFFGALLALILILAVPVVSAYVAYKLTTGENPFQWPPTMDLSRVF